MNEMELEKFVQGFADQFEDTQPDEIKASTKFKDLDEWSSLTAMLVIAFVKTEYGQDIGGQDIRNSDTVEELYKLILVKDRNGEEF